MIKITDAILPVGHTSRPGGHYDKTTVTIHETGNPNKGAGAYNHALYARNRTDKLGAHYYVDDISIYRTIPDGEAANHSGSSTGNKYSIAIEICINPDSNFAVACDNAAELAAKLLKERGLSVASLRQHYNWNGKNCPATLRKSGWAAFVASVEKKIEGVPAVPEKKKDNTPAAWAKDALDWAVKNGLLVGDADGDLKLREPVTREQMVAVLYRYHAKNS